jgi:hypothetical protein
MEEEEEEEEEPPPRPLRRRPVLTFSDASGVTTGHATFNTSVQTAVHVIPLVPASEGDLGPLEVPPPVWRQRRESPRPLLAWSAAPPERPDITTPRLSPRRRRGPKGPLGLRDIVHRFQQYPQVIDTSEGAELAPRDWSLRRVLADEKSVTHVRVLTSFGAGDASKRMGGSRKKAVRWL